MSVSFKEALGGKKFNAEEEIKEIVHTLAIGSV